MPLVPIPIGKGVYTNVDSTSVKAPDSATALKNLVIDDAGANIDRPALSSTTFGSTGAAHGIIGSFYFNVSDTVVLVDSNRKIWSQTSSGATTLIGYADLDGTERPTFASDGTYLAIAGGGTPQRWSGTGVTIDMPGSPPDTSNIAYLDGYWLATLAGDQEVRFAGPTPVARETWNSSDFFSAEGLPDGLVASVVNIREFYAIGPDSTEIFQNFGASSNPFSRTFFIDRGTIAPRSVIRWDNAPGWLDDKKRVVRMQANTPTHISGPIQRTLDAYTAVDDCWAATIEIGGLFFVVFVFPTMETAWAMNQKTGEWFEWDGLTGPNQRRFPMNAYVKAWDRHLVGDPYTGVVRELSFGNKVDGPDVLRRLRRMRYTHGTGQRKRSNYYLFDVKCGVGTDGGTVPVFEVRVNDDNKGWSSWKQVALGNPGAQQRPARVRLGGIYRERQLEIQATEPYAFSLVSVQEDIDLLGA